MPLQAKLNVTEDALAGAIDKVDAYIAAVKTEEVRKQYEAAKGEVQQRQAARQAQRQAAEARKVAEEERACGEGARRARGEGARGDSDAEAGSAVQLREKVQEGSYNVQRFEEKKRLEQLLEEHTAQLMTSSTAGESTEALKMQAARLQAEAEGSRKEVVRLLEVEQELRERLHGALEETREHKRRGKVAEDGETAARELMEDAVAAREPGGRSQEAAAGLSAGAGAVAGGVGGGAQRRGPQHQRAARHHPAATA